LPQAEDAFKKALELNPINDRACLELAYCYRDQVKLPQAEDAFKKAVELSPRKDTAYIQLGLFYRDHFKKPARAEQAFKKAIGLNPQNLEAYVELGRCFSYNGKFAQAEESFKKAIKLDSSDDRAYRGCAAVYSEMGKDKLAQEYYGKANRLGLGNYSLVTAHNYQELKMILDKRGIKLVCIQYPLRSIEPLKRMLQGQDGVIFVDNEKVFKDALKKGSFKDYFIDMFAGEFGHCTRKGNRLLAENIANTILKEYFKK
jgi:Tfp pilus assembly protein PilF